MLIAKGIFSHISKLDGSFRTRVHEPVATLRMKLGSGDHLCQFLHVCGLYVNDVEALILYVEVPEVYSKVITADECLAIAIDRYAVNVVCMGVGVVSTRNRSNHSIVMCQAWEF